VSALLALALGSLAAPAPDDWPAWRGPGATGVAAGPAPTRWSDEENVAWKLAVAGRGFSTPIVHGGKVFLTTAIPLEELPEPEEAEGGEGGRDLGAFGGGGPQPKSAFVALAVDLATGKELWRRVCREATPHEGYHRTYGSHASCSPVTDGERLFVSFGSFGAYCFDLAGKLLWERDLGVALSMRNSFGEGSAPVLAGDKLVQVYDHEGDSFVVALDARTGEERWRVARDERSSWAMPLVTEWEGKTLVVTSATNRVRAYDAADGALVWECGGLGANAIPAVVRHGDDVIAMTGYRDPNLLCIRLGGAGDLTGTDAVRWTTAKGTAYTASPVLHQGLYYSATDRGFLSCWEAEGGEPVYVEERLPRGTQLKASPIAAGDHLYVATESGDVHLIRLGPVYEHVATNTLEGQFFVASPVAVDGKLLLRSQTHLLCIGESEE